MRRSVALLLALSLVMSLGTTAALGRPSGDDAGPLTYDDYVTGHLEYPAVEQAERFVARQEKLAARPAASQDGAYGRAGCKPPTEYEVGDERTFWVSQNQAGNIEITAVLAAKSPHGYMWVQREFYVPAPGDAPEGGFVTQSEAELGLEKWEGIYDIDRSYFGIEPNPASPAQNLPPGLPANWRDADCDKHVHILNFPIDAGNEGLGYTAGYYSSEHEYPNGDGEHESPFSNEAEMFFMNSLHLNVGDDTYAGVLAHEFFHMIQFSNDYNEETWVNEGMADIAAVVNGFGDIVQGHIDAYEETPDQHLFDWTGVVDDYGQAFLFFDYLFNHYGLEEKEKTDQLEAYGLAQLLTRTPADGAKGITQVIRTRDDSLVRSLAPYYRKGNFGKVFKDYLVANYLDDPAPAHGQFGYANREVEVVGTGTEDASPADSTVHPYGADYYEVTGEGTFRAKAQDPVAVIPATEGQPAPEGGKFAWSNRADEMITWLERPADLSDAAAPTLTFDYWHQIEEDWDYAYIRISQDRGATYDFVPAADCGGRATNPNGNNRAVAESGGITGDSEGWQQCSLDLTQWAGGPALIRFEYDTDQATTEPGYVVDNVKLADGDKTIWRKTKFEKRTRAFDFGGDSLKKWMALKPLKKNKPLVQVVQVSGNSAVRYALTRKHFRSTKNGLKLRRPAGVRGDKTIFVFSATTAIATTPFGYSYKVKR
ncbi:MAG TPA: hypothetical protein VG318_15535 [Actinomycetota bacterium]|nr:hypothetical protein [Actinomycetota bacterium]